MAYTRLGKFASLFCCRRVFALASRLVRRRRMARVCIHSAHTHEVREGERVICQQKVEKDTEDEGEEGRRREASKTRTKKKKEKEKKVQLKRLLAVHSAHLLLAEVKGLVLGVLVVFSHSSARLLVQNCLCPGNGLAHRFATNHKSNKSNKSNNNELTCQHLLLFSLLGSCVCCKELTSWQAWTRSHRSPAQHGGQRARS